MNRNKFLKSLALIPFGMSVSCQKLQKLTQDWEWSDRMPALFVGHGSPMNAIEDNLFSKSWAEIGGQLPRPKAILCISAHWETNGTQVTAMAMPPTIHDFGGFPQALFDVEYEAPGSTWLVNEVKSTATNTTISDNHDWGLDHGCWSVLNKMYPDADIPVIQMSLDYTKGAEYHYALGQELAALRHKGVLILGSGNMVHNLRMARIGKNGFNSEDGYDWAYKMNDIFKEKIYAGDHRSMVQYQNLDKAASLAIPTTDHYFPLLYPLAVQDPKDDVTIFNDQAVAGSLTMTSVLIS